tara:strand:- start:72 stop:560 length:489 start_codon:yes stop_codon:yes gene_type:complete
MTNKLKIFVDMDGVLADFVQGVQSPEFLNSPLTNDADYDNRKLELSNKGLFAKLPKMEDMDHLVDHIKSSGEYWEILTATGDVNRSRVAADKNQWIRKYVDPDVLITCTIKGKHKAVFARPNHVLIDDRLENIQAWTKAGGIGILHKNAQGTINKLTPLFFS